MTEEKTYKKLFETKMQGNDKRRPWIWSIKEKTEKKSNKCERIKKMMHGRERWREKCKIVKCKVRMHIDFNTLVYSCLLYTSRCV